MSTSKQNGIPVWSLEAVCSASYPLSEGQVTCVLYRLSGTQMADGTPAGGTPGYMIGMESRDDSSLCFAGTEAAEAEDFFRLLVRNTVSPCTLGDIAADRRQ